MRERGAEMLGLVNPFLLWGLGFVLLYAAHGLACDIGVRPGHYDGLTRLVLAGMLAVLVAAHVWLSFRYWQRLKMGGNEPLRFLRLAAFVVSVAALGTSLWTGTPVLYLSICA